jgi:hypothetical protein
MGSATVSKIATEGGLVRLGNATTSYGTRLFEPEIGVELARQEASK